MIALWKWVWPRKYYALLAAVILWLAAARFTSDRAHAAEIAAREKAFQETAQKLGAAVAQEKSAGQIAAELSDKNAALVAALKKAEKSSHVVEHTTDTVVIHDQVEAQQTSLTTWQDKWGRFKLDLSTSTFTRDQRFRLEGVIVEGPGGAKVRGVNLVEIAPNTGEVIPNEGIQITSSFEVVKETPPVGAFHPRALAVLGSGGYGLGAQFFNFKDRFDLDAVAVYNPGTKSVKVGPVVAWRVKLPFLDTNLAVGPSYLYDVKLGTWTLGAAATIELTR